MYNEAIYLENSEKMRVRL